MKKAVLKRVMRKREKGLRRRRGMELRKRERLLRERVQLREKVQLRREMKQHHKRVHRMGYVCICLNML